MITGSLQKAHPTPSSPNPFQPQPLPAPTPSGTAWAALGGMSGGSGQLISCKMAEIKQTATRCLLPSAVHAALEGVGGAFCRLRRDACSPTAVHALFLVAQTLPVSCMSFVSYLVAVFYAQGNVQHEHASQLPTALESKLTYRMRCGPPFCMFGGVVRVRVRVRVRPVHVPGSRWLCL